MSLVIPPTSIFKLEDRGKDWAYICKLCGDVQLVDKEISGDWLREAMNAHACKTLSILSGGENGT